MPAACPTLGLALLCAAAGLADGKKLSNVILFVVDDLGWADLAMRDLPPKMARTAGGHAEYSTPHLDKLASEGVLLDRYYVNQLCECQPADVIGTPGAGRALEFHCELSCTQVRRCRYTGQGPANG